MERVTKKECFAALPPVKRATAFVLGADPKGKTFLYCTEKSVIIRDIENPKEHFAYVEHQKPPRVAKYAPSGYYICSGDASGKVRIWDTTQVTHILKCEFQPLGGTIKDIAWDADSKRIAVAGEGREKFAHVFLWDSGSSVGELTKMTKHCNSVSIKQTRPYRCAVASEDYSTYFYAGPPFKMDKTLDDGTNFINCVRFAPDGSVFAAGGSDGHVWLYEGKTAARIGELESKGKHAHKGGVYSLDFSPDSKEMITASADKTVRLWSVESRSMLLEFVMGTTIDDQQLSCLWQGDNIMSVSLSGDINFLNREDASKPLRVITGHKVAITSVAVKQGEAIFTGSFDGNVVKWNPSTGDAVKFTGKGHGTNIIGMVYDEESNELVTVGIDETVRFTDCDRCQFSPDRVVSLDSEPASVARSGDGHLVVACHKSLVLIKDARKLCSLPWNADHPSRVTVCGSSICAIGTKEAKMGVETSSVRFYEIDAGAVVAADQPTVAGLRVVTAVGYSPDGSQLAVADGKNVGVHLKCDDFKKSKVCDHNTRVSAVAWSPDGRLLACACIDSSLWVWNSGNGRSVGRVQGAHPKAIINALTWLDDDVIVTVGDDCAVTQWKVAI